MLGTVGGDKGNQPLGLQGALPEAQLRYQQGARSLWEVAHKMNPRGLGECILPYSKVAILFQVQVFKVLQNCPWIHLAISQQLQAG